MGKLGDWITAHGINWVMGGRRFRELRREVLTGLSGNVLEIGFGTGLNLSFYPPSVKKVLAVEPSEAAKSLARRKTAPGQPEVEFIGMTAETIPLPDASVDLAVTTWTLCSIPDLPKALKEIHRVLVPGGRFVFLEHGLSNDPGIARWQAWLTPLQKKLAGGCHLNRKMDSLIAESGFGFESLKNFYMKGPKPWTFLYQGAALKRRI